MDIKIPFESIVDFKTNVYEITKISLEHEYTVNDEYILGNFIVSGEYKSHEISINKEEFSFVLPFQVEILKDVDINTIEFDIEDFTYELIDNARLKINIEYSINGKLSEISIEYERLDDEIITDHFDLTELCDVEENEENLLLEESIELMPENIPEVIEKEKEDTMKIENREITEEIKNDILSNINIQEEDYVTYHIHIVKENENIESICKKYNISSLMVSEYNDISELNEGDKILIPFDNE